uniref:Uncharacterized protein n=1 Tax=Noctiluca scintillans TaxID=2966 RepID=A7WQ72_NOCSC|nr:unknown [Noctiluca scintillans]ABV22365.1 unknown [Noctiluca scintillans]
MLRCPWVPCQGITRRCMAPPQRPSCAAVTGTVELGTRECARTFRLTMGPVRMEVGRNCSKKLAPASCPRPVSRPCTACSVQDGTSPARVHHSMSPSSSLVRGSVKDEVTQYARRPPGEIRRGVSLPARRSPGASGSSRGPNEWKLSLMPRLPEQMDTMSTGAVTALQGTQGLRSGAKPMRPGSNSVLADHEIENVIPGDSGDSSDDGDEVLSPVRPCGAGG